jgi:LemA protein
MTPFSAVLIVCAAALAWAAMAYNSLVRGRNRAAAAWSQIDVQLKRRHDLIPNLVRTLEGYLHHERGTLDAVTRARQAALEAAGDVLRRSEAEGALGRSLGSLSLLVERYPDLRAVAAVRDLMEQLATAENRIAFARQHYNDLVAAQNSRIDTFPSNIIAGRSGFSPLEYFRLDEPPANG